MKDQADRLRELALTVKQQIENEIYMNLKHTRVIAVSSGKGGTGKSTLALNLSIALSSQGKKVILMDADMGLANIDIMLGIVPAYNIYHFVQGQKSLREIILSHPTGIDIIPGGSGITELANLHREQLKRILVELGALDGEYDFMIIDTGAGISDSVLSFLLAADDVLVVTTPEPTSITDAYGVVKGLSQHHFAGNLYLIVNRVENNHEGVLLAEKFRLVCNKFLNLDIKVLGYVVNEPLIKEAIKRQTSFLNIFPQSVAARNIYDISSKLLSNDVGGDKREIQKYGGIKNFFKKLINFSKLQGE
ncbi:flagellar biosynthesis protein FlhG [Thermosyntropha lipolytica DSM 11003]|uniref:Flagellar biosynthesis protein FlhG n=1 Tax=Thermosyntropha lipolytica DSM 11003 TaxID=1123382 RepID=A0A1M5KZU4_9FIRM|nr:MinD/ParA family protein [Thermosyntropha lipolytica]SHG57683.1 flagellar biosynthesis protein FlhG [Thermosyntropha lipolytica DSM 11003]